jgi:hypothetical protein
VGRSIDSTKMYGPPPHGVHPLDPLNCPIDQRHALGDQMRRQGEGFAYMASLTQSRYLANSSAPVDTLTTMNNRAVAMAERGDLKRARALHEQVLVRRRRENGEEHPETLISMSNLAVAMQSQGDLHEARTLHEQVLATRRRVLGVAHPDTLLSMNNLANALWWLQDLDRARVLYEEALEGLRRILGEQHPQTRATTSNLADLERRSGRARTM